MTKFVPLLRQYSLKFSLNYAIQGILSFNDKPLRMCINFGLFCLLIWLLWTFCCTLYRQIRDEWIFHNDFSVVLFGGIQLIRWGIRRVHR